ncbi:MAG: fibronectin type III domain-containing protein [Bacteroidales bacterium]|nr:fibronectin type III domain-containing protein [Candidatus Colimorpha merdihippi]
MKRFNLLLVLIALSSALSAAPLFGTNAMLSQMPPLPTVGSPLHYVCNFENPTENALWQLANGSQNNQWVIDSAAHADGLMALYISNDSGATNTYSSGNTFVYASRSFGALVGGTYRISYDWRASGESNYDFLRVFLVPDTTTLTPGLSPSGSSSSYSFGTAVPNGWISLDNRTRLNGQSSWTHFTQLVDVPADGQWKLVVMWCNDASVNNSPAGGIDNIAFGLFECYQPISPIASSTRNSISVSWTEQGTASAWVVELVAPNQTLGHGTRVTTTSTAYTFTDLNESTEYHIYIAASCGAGDTSSWTEIVQHTACPLMNALPFYETFTNIPDGSIASNQFIPCWTRISNGNPNLHIPYVTTSTELYLDESPNKLLVWNNQFDTNSLLDYHGIVLPGIDNDVYPINQWIMSFWITATDSVYHPEFIIGVMTDPNNMATFQPVDTLSINADGAWYSLIPNFWTFNGNGSHIAILSRRSSGPWTAYIDNFSLSGYSACPTSVNLAANSVGATSAYLTWNLSDESSYVDQYIMFIQKEGELTTDTLMVWENRYMLSGLDPNTSYTVTVQAYCSDELSGVAATTQFVTNSLPCIQADDSTNSSFFTILDGTAQVSNIPVNTSWGNTMCQSIYTAEELAAAGVNPGMIAGLSYYFTNNANWPKSFSIYISTTEMDVYSSGNDQISPATQTLVYGPAAHPTGTSGWQDYTFTEPFYWDGASNLVITTFMNQPAGASHSSSGFYGYSTNTHVNRSAVRYMDNTAFTPDNYTTRSCFLNTSVPSIKVIEYECSQYASCAAPLVVVENIGANEATAVWAPGLDETSWMVEYRPRGGEWVVLDSVVYDTRYEHYDFLPGHHYQFRITALCSDTTNVSSVVEFVTDCGMFITPFREDFEDWTTNTYLPDCWQRYSNIGPNYPAASNVYSYGGNYSLMLYSTDTTYSAIVLPQMLSWANENQISFNMYKPNANAAHRLVVGVCEDPSDITTFYPIDTVQCTAVGQWQQFDIPLDSYDGYGDFITLMSPLGETSYPYIDNIAVDLIPLCRVPAGFQVEAAGNSWLDLSWQMQDDVTYIIEYDTLPIPESEYGRGLHPFITDSSSATRLTNLDPNTTYYLYLFASCGEGMLSMPYCTTAQTLFSAPASMPFICTFEGSEADEWQLLNDGQTNQWFIGGATHNGGNYSLYVSNNFGLANEYNNASTSSVFAVRSLAITDTGEYAYSFDWKTSGESCCDYMNVAIMPLGLPLAAGLASEFTATAVPGQAVRLFDSGTMNGHEFWTTQSGTFSISTPGTYQLVFYWHNDGSIGNNPPAAVDNIVIHSNICTSPANLMASNVGSSDVTLEWTPGGFENSWLVSCAGRNFIATDTTYTLTGLHPAARYIINVYSLCDNGDTSLATSITVNTACGNFGVLPLTEDFNTYANGQIPNCWNIIPNGNYPYVTSDHGTSIKFGGSAAVITPRIPAAANSLYVSFDLRKEGSLSGTMQLGYTTDAAHADSTMTLIATYSPETTGQYYHYEIDLSSLSCTDSVYLMWRQSGNSSWYYWLDNVVVERSSSCPMINDFAVRSYTHREVTLNWSDNENNIGTRLYLADINDRTQAIDSAYVPAGTNSHTFYNLNGSTHYYAWALATCASQDSRAQAVQFTTLPDCAPVVNLTASHVDYYGFALAWQTPTDGEPVNDFIVSYKPAATDTWTNDTVSQTYYYVVGLDTNQTYDYRVGTLCDAASGSFVSGSVTTKSCSLTIGNGGTSNSYIPAYPYYDYSYSQQIHLSSELGDIDTISAISFYINGTLSTRNLSLYLGNTSQSSFSSTSDYIDSTQLTQVFSGTVSRSGAGWVTINLDNNFVRNAGDNLVIAVDDNTGSWVTSPQWATNETENARAIYFYQDNNNISYATPTSSYSGTLNRTNQIRVSGPTCNIPECPGPNPIITELTHYAVTFTWYQISDTSEYHIWYKLSSTSRWILVDGNNTEGYIFFDGFEPNTGYDFRIDNYCGNEIVSTVFSFVTLPLPCPSLASDTTVTACDSFNWHGTTYDHSTVYPTHTYVNEQGCDSVVTLHLTILHSNSSTLPVTACDSYAWHDSTYTASTTATYTTTNAAGCDSTVTLNLTLHASTASTMAATACDTYTWNGTTYTASTAANYVTLNADGCDSTVTLNLTILNSTASTDIQSACDSLLWHGTTYTASTTTPTYTTSNAAGCDSIVTLQLTINNSTSSTDVQSACDSLLWHGTLYTASTATPTYTTTNAAGCDSIVTLQLTINNSTTGIDVQSALDSLLWHGNTYTASTATPTYTTTNAAGCDSIVTLQLTIHNSTSSTETISACDSLVWNGNTHLVSGTDTYTGTNAQGCDSTVTLQLTIHNSSTTRDSIVTCDSLYWNGNTYYASTHDLIILTDANGCDSTRILDLTIHYSSHATIQDSAVGSYTWNGETYTESGEYLFEGTTAEGCDSTITLILTIIENEGIQVADGISVLLYPNPTSGLVTVEADELQRIDIYDYAGRLIERTTNSRIDLTARPAGTYLLRITTARGTTLRRVVKK